MGNSSVQSARKTAEQIVSRARPSIKILARLGYAAKGIVYVLVGMMAMLVSLGRRGPPVDFSEVLIVVFHQHLGGILLALLAVGLAGYGLWCVVQAVMDTENKGTNFFGIVTRFFYAVVGFVYFGLTWSASQLLTKTGHVTPGDQPEKELTARVFAVRPYSRWLVALIGVGFVGFCILEFRRAWAGSFRILKVQGTTSEAEDRTTTWIARVGITARAVVFALIGAFLIQSGIDYDPTKVRGINGIVTTLKRQPHGQWLLATMAVGLIAYGVYMLFLSWRRRIDPI